MKADVLYIDAPRANTLQVGLEYQDFICKILAQDNIILQNLSSRKYQFKIGENLQGFEIKYDERCTDTNQLSIEIAEKTRNDESLQWTPSGIMRPDNTWLYIQGNYQIIFVMARKALRLWIERNKPAIHESHGTIRKFYLPFRSAEILAAKIYRNPVMSDQLRHP